MTITVAIHGAEQTSRARAVEGRPVGSAAWGACV